MRNSLLYVATVFIWGSTWLAIEYQLGEVAVEVSLVYRFVIAAFLMWGFCLFRGISLRFNMVNHGFIILLALGNFSINYMFMYLAQGYLTSAMTSIAFSTMLLMNIVNSRLFFGTKIAPRTYIGACFGVLGIVALFWNDLQDINFSDQSLFGLGLVLTGTLVASFGNMVSVRNSNKGLNIFAVNAWGMLYATAALTAYALFKGSAFVFSSQPSYLISLLYLSVFGTVIAFATYFILLKNLGTEQASYVIVLFPIIAVCLSSLFEGFVWTTSVFVGFAMVLIGNIIMLTSPEKFTFIINSIKNRPRA